MSSSDGQTGSEIEESKWFDKSKRKIFPVYPIMNDILVYYFYNCDSNYLKDRKGPAIFFKPRNLSFFNGSMAGNTN